MNLLSDSGRSVSLAADETALIDRVRAPWSIAIHPSAGASASVAVTITPTAQLRMAPETARWVTIEDAVTSSTLVVFAGPVTAIRVASSGGATVFEYVQ
jgi:hypothetical protein